MLDLIIYYGIITLASLIAVDYNFLFKLMLLDNFFLALQFVKTYINRNLTESQIVTDSNKLYIGSALDRYIYYAILYGGYNILCTFFWISESYLLYYLGMLTIIPTVLNKILESKLFQLIKDKKELLIKMMISKTFTTIIKFYSKIYLDRDLNIKHSEILILLKDYKDTVSYFTDVLKNLFIMVILSYIKNYSQPLYYGIIKYIYNYKTGELLVSYNTMSAKHHLINIIDNKQWRELTKPNTYKALLYLYQINDNKTDTLKKFINSFNFSLIKMFTLWTICSLINCIYLVPLGSILLILFGKYVRKEINNNLTNDLIMIGVSAIMSYFYPSYAVISAMCQFGSKIFLNGFTFAILRITHKFLRKKISEIINNNRELVMSYIITIIYSIILKYVAIGNSYIIICLNIMANALMSIETKKQMITGIVISSSYLSQYNIFHILFNSLTLYIITGVIDRSNMYTFQDTFRLLIDNLSEIINNLISIIVNMLRYIYGHYNTIRQIIRDKIKNVLFRMIDTKKDKKTKLIFDLMDTDKFPSISLTKSELFGKNMNINNIKVDDSVIEDSVSLDDKLFDQPEDIFINGISIEEKSNCEIHERKKTGSYEIIDNYYDTM